MKISDFFDKRPLELNEAANSDREFTLLEIDFIEPESGDSYYEPFDVVVTYEYENMGSSDHPYGETYATEHHGFAFGLISAVSIVPIEERFIDSNAVKKIWPIGTDVTELSGWNDKHLDWFLGACEEDFNS